MPLWKEIDVAYDSMGCNSSTSDEDVVVAYYPKLQSSSLGFDYSGHLKTIALERKSCFLLFILSIHQHLNNENVAILAKKVPVILATPETNIEHVESSQPEGTLSSGTDTELDEYGEPYGTQEETSETKSSGLKSPSSLEADLTSSSDDVIMDSDFEEDVGGIDFGNSSWRCEDCGCSIEDGSCPNGHDLKRCMTCDWQLVNGICPSCDGCGMGKEDGGCPGCASDGDEDFIVSDSHDGIWRCIYCQWEVEADNETDGNCHCLNPQREARYLDLSECPDYHPADFDSSSDESASDEEPDSEDERFIDNEAVAVEGVFDHATEATSLASITLEGRGPNSIHRAAKDAKTMVAAEDKENMEPDISTDAAIVAGPDVGGSNIVDIESMDM
jgi:hypothetical protein